MLLIILAILTTGLPLESNTRIKGIDEELLVGTRYYKWSDKSRLDEEYEKGSFREIHVQVWFPIDTETVNLTNHKRADYLPELEKAKPFLTNWSPQDFLQAENVRTNAVETSRISTRKPKYPVLLLSPGLAGHTSFYSFYAERLASLGYVVAGVNHKYDSNYIVTKEGKVVYRNIGFYDDLKRLKIPEEITAEGYRKKRSKRISILGKDLMFCIDQLESVNGLDFGNRLDLQNIGALGHSVGGGAAVEAAKLDKRIDAAINIDGTPSYWALKTGMTQDFMYIEDQKDLSQRGNKIQHNRRNDFCAKVKNDCYRVMLEGTNHNSFLGSNYYDATTPAEKEQVLQTLNLTLEYIVFFFDKYLRGRTVEIKGTPDGKVEVLRFLQKNS